MTRRRRFGRFGFVLLSTAAVSACAPHAPPPVRQAAAPAPLAVAAALDLEPLNLSPDGELRLLVRLRYTAAGGGPAHVPPGGHVDVFADRGRVQWQPRAQYGDPAAIVRLTEAGPLALRVDSDLPHLPRRLTATTDTRAWRLPPVTARALGPHAVSIGWFPRVHDGRVRIERSAAAGGRVTAVVIAAPASSFQDTGVAPGAHYTYAVLRPGADRIDVAVDVPPELPQSTAAVLRGKAMWLAFDDDVTAWNVDAMLDRAASAGVRAVQLRLAYGEYAQITAVRKATIDRFLDGAAARGIAILAWTVPRAVSFEDLATNVATLVYRTAAGNGPSGLAVDLERGADFLGTGPVGREALATYLHRLREAVGPGVLLVATVEDPYIENLGPADVPYAAIAADADVLQPMVYWRARRSGASTAGVRATLTAAYSALRQLAGMRVAIDIGGQTASLGNRFGAPPPAEVAASLMTARQLGAIGETFFDWDGTSAEQWTAIGATAWPR